MKNRIDVNVHKYSIRHKNKEKEFPSFLPITKGPWQQFQSSDLFDFDIFLFELCMLLQEYVFEEQ